MKRHEKMKMPALFTLENQNNNYVQGSFLLKISKSVFL